MAPYKAKAVHFDGSTFLQNNALVSNDNGKFSISFFYKFKTPIGFQPAAEFWNVDPFATDCCFVFTPNMSPAGYSMQMELADINFLTTWFTSTPRIRMDENWHWFLASFDTTINNTPSAVYIDGQLLTTDLTVPANFSTNGLLNIIGDTSGGGGTYPYDLADFWVAVGTSLLGADGLISAATMRQFTDASGRPLNPSHYPAGATILFSGDKTTFGNNQGTGGAFVLNGAFTNAATSPSDSPLGWPYSNTSRSSAVSGAGGGAVPQYGYSDPRSADAFIIALNALDANFTLSKWDRRSNKIVNQATLVASGIPAIASMSESDGLVGPWNDPSRLLAIGSVNLGAGGFDWYLFQINRATLAVTPGVRIIAGNVQLPMNNPEQMSCSSDGRFAAFCTNSALIPVPGASHVAVCDTSFGTCAITTATALGITTDSFQVLNMDAANNIYCLGQALMLYKLTFNPASLACALVSAVDLSLLLPAPVLRWTGARLTYRPTRGTLLVWTNDTGAIPFQTSYVMEISTSGKLISGPYKLPDFLGQNVGGGSFNPNGVQMTSPLSHWNDADIFVNETIDPAFGANADFQLTDMRTGITTKRPHTLWEIEGDIGLSVYDPQTNSIWTQAFNMVGNNLTPQPFALFGLNPASGTVPPGQGKLPFTPAKFYAPLRGRFE